MQRRDFVKLMTGGLAGLCLPATLVAVTPTPVTPSPEQFSDQGLELGTACDPANFGEAYRLAVSELEDELLDAAGLVLDRHRGVGFTVPQCFTGQEDKTFDPRVDGDLPTLARMYKFDLFESRRVGVAHLDWVRIATPVITVVSAATPEAGYNILYREVEQLRKLLLAEIVRHNSREPFAVKRVAYPTVYCDDVKLHDGREACELWTEMYYSLIPTPQVEDKISRALKDALV